MAKNAIATPYDDNGFPGLASATAAVTLGGTVTIKPSPGRLFKVIVTTLTATATATIYDNASAGSGLALLVIPAAAAVGTIYTLDVPALNGLTIASSGATGAVTIGYA